MSKNGQASYQFINCFFSHAIASESMSLAASQKLRSKLSDRLSAGSAAHNTIKAPMNFKLARLPQIGKCRFCWHGSSQLTKYRHGVAKPEQISSVCKLHLLKDYARVLEDFV